MKDDLIIVGAGLAGLCCARRAHREGLRCRILEASDGVGGRIRTDRIDGFRLDRGFQVFLTAYPEAQDVLDYEALDLKPFLPGALVRHDGAFHPVVDPWRRPLAGLRAAFSPVGSLMDKLRVARLRRRTTSGTLEDLLLEPEMSTRDALEQDGFSPRMVDRFFRPFLGGIFLEPDLDTSSRMFHFVFRMFSIGDTCLPADGMEAIPRQIAAALPPETVRLGARVSDVERGRVRLASGEILETRAVVVATDGATASSLLVGPAGPEPCGVTCIYFAADEPPLEQPMLALDGTGGGPVNNLCVPSTVAPSYAPSGQSLVSATVLGAQDRPGLLKDVRSQLADWFGPVVDDWRQLTTYRIPYALPNQAPPALSPPERPVRLEPGLYVCGDHRDTASIQGAMVSGRRAAEAVLEDLS